MEPFRLQYHNSVNRRESSGAACPWWGRIRSGRARNRPRSHVPRHQAGERHAMVAKSRGPRVDRTRRTQKQKVSFVTFDVNGMVGSAGHVRSAVVRVRANRRSW